MCIGRCECHKAEWDILDKAAGVEPPRRTGGRKPSYPEDATKFRRDLRRNYIKEWEALSEKDPNNRPTKTAVAENRFKFSERTLRRALTKFADAGARWPPAIDEAA